MSPQAALAEIDRVLNERPGDLMVGKAPIRAVLETVQPRYWLPAETDRLVTAYKSGDFGETHRVIDRIIARDYGELDASTPRVAGPDR